METKDGSIEIICGPMFSGKTEELIRKIRRFDYAKKKYAIFTPKIDTRGGFNDVYSHNGNRMEAVSVSSASDILTYLRKHKNIEIVAIDNLQFFDKYIIKLLKALLYKGYNVIGTGLEKDFRGEPFGPMPELLALATRVKKLTSICNICGKDADYTQRMVKGKAVLSNDEIIQVGAEESYEARCLEHHEITGKEEFNIF